MSHFSVAVFVDPKSGKNVTDLLAPFHEFECTGDVNEYVQSIDETEEMKKEYEEGKRTRLKAFDGTLYSPHDDQFYCDPTPEEEEKMGKFPGSGVGNNISWTSKDWGDGRGYRVKVKFIPEGYEEVEVKLSDMMTFKEFVCDYHEKPVVKKNGKPDLHDEHKWGWARIDDDGNVMEVIRRTNPNRKWDYWVIGGRYRDSIWATTGEMGEKPFTSLLFEEKEPDKPYKFDIARVRDLIHNPYPEEYVEAIRKWEVLVEKAAPKNDKERELAKFSFITPEMLVKKYRDKETYAKISSTFYTYAVVTPDGVWHEKGEMGWFGCSSETPDESLDWDLHYKERFIDTAEPDWLIYCIDCHI